MGCRTAQNRAAYATWILATLNAAVFVAALLGADTSSLNIAGSILARPSAVLTYMFNHADFIHFATNVALLVVAGTIFERKAGPLKTVAVYFVGGIAGGVLFGVVCQMLDIEGVTLSGASAATLALCTAALCSSPGVVERLRHTPAAIAGIAMAAVVIFWGAAGDNPGGALAHLGGIAVGLALTPVLMPRRRKRLPADDNSEIITKARRSGFSSLTPEERKRLTRD